jgi:N6-adenosine-specific RNA methylase IME4
LLRREPNLGELVFFTPSRSKAFCSAQSFRQAQLVEATSPGDKVELFCRERREGWHVHGNDTGRFANKED